MPEQTPIYGFPYPCPQELVTSQSFTDLANAIDQQLALLDTHDELARNRPYGRLIGTTQTAAAGVENNSSGANSVFTVPTAGVYVVTIFFRETSPPASCTGIRIRVLQSGSPVFGDELNPDAGGFERNATSTGIVQAAAGDPITSTLRFEGSGNMSYVFTLEAAMIVKTF